MYLMMALLSQHCFHMSDEKKGGQAMPYFVGGFIFAVAVITALDD